ncbi:hypothetical protein LCGC14_1033820 [marine sediment metagenome]|uniref:signal peptidase I n=1 Tax=marine sediment metagenome TaxID=412755 RepID=A0A0F9QBX9_9ZZZZ
MAENQAKAVDTKIEPEVKTESKEEQSLSKKALSFLKELVILVAVAFVLAFVFKTFIFQPFRVEMSSMTPTILPNERVLVNKFLYRFSKPSNGDVVTLYSPEKSAPETGFNIMHLFSGGPRKILIKRIVATEGQTVLLKQSKMYVDGKEIKESYVKIKDFNGFGPQKVAKNHVFVMGDNRINSKDSRMFGSIKKSELLGKAFFVYWPPPSFKGL